MTHSSEQGGGKHIAKGLADQEALREVIGDKQGAPGVLIPQALLSGKRSMGTARFPRTHSSGVYGATNSGSGEVQDKMPRSKREGK